MKRSGFDHPKHGRLCRLLKINRCVSIGIMESIWQFTAKHAPAGDIGKWTDEEIAEAIDFDSEPPEKLIEALVKARWLDDSDEFRLVVHDWDEHCEDSIHVTLARRAELFANGRKPKLTRISEKEREQIEARYALKANDERACERTGTHEERTTNARHTHEERTAPAPAPAPAKPEPKPLPKPCHESERSTPAAGDDGGGKKKPAGVFADLTKQDLEDDAKLLAWHQFASSRKKPVVSPSENDRRHVFEAAVRALESGSETPVHLFTWIVAGKHWDRITQAQEDRAAARLKRALGLGPPARGNVRLETGPRSIGEVLSGAKPP